MAAARLVRSAETVALRAAATEIARIFKSCERTFAVTPILSIGRTSASLLRRLPAAALVER
jgi:hypothetical protein